MEGLVASPLDFQGSGRVFGYVKILQRGVVARVSLDGCSEHSLEVRILSLVLKIQGSGVQVWDIGTLWTKGERAL